MGIVRAQLSYFLSVPPEEVIIAEYTPTRIAVHGVPLPAMGSSTTPSVPGAEGTNRLLAEAFAGPDDTSMRRLGVTTLVLHVTFHVAVPIANSSGLASFARPQDVATAQSSLSSSEPLLWTQVASRVMESLRSLKAEPGKLASHLQALLGNDTGHVRTLLARFQIPSEMTHMEVGTYMSSWTSCAIPAGTVCVPSSPLIRRRSVWCAEPTNISAPLAQDLCLLAQQQPPSLNLSHKEPCSEPRGGPEPPVCGWVSSNWTACERNTGLATLIGGFSHDGKLIKGPEFIQRRIVHCLSAEDSGSPSRCVGSPPASVQACENSNSSMAHLGALGEPSTDSLLAKVMVGLLLCACLCVPCVVYACHRRFSARRHHVTLIEDISESSSLSPRDISQFDAKCTIDGASEGNDSAGTGTSSCTPCVRTSSMHQLSMVSTRASSRVSGHIEADRPVNGCQERAVTKLCSLNVAEADDGSPRAMPWTHAHQRDIESPHTPTKRQGSLLRSIACSSELSGPHWMTKQTVEGQDGDWHEACKTTSSISETTTAGTPVWEALGALAQSPENPFMESVGMCASGLDIDTSSSGAEASQVETCCPVSGICLRSMPSHVDTSLDEAWDRLHTLDTDLIGSPPSACSSPSGDRMDHKRVDSSQGPSQPPLAAASLREFSPPRTPVWKAPGALVDNLENPFMDSLGMCASRLDTSGAEASQTDTCCPGSGICRKSMSLQVEAWDRLHTLDADLMVSPPSACLGASHDRMEHELFFRNQSPFQPSSAAGSLREFCPPRSPNLPREHSQAHESSNIGGADPPGIERLFMRREVNRSSSIDCRTNELELTEADAALECVSPESDREVGSLVSSRSLTANEQKPIAFETNLATHSRACTNLDTCLRSNREACSEVESRCAASPSQNYPGGLCSSVEDDVLVEAWEYLRSLESDLRTDVSGIEHYARLDDRIPTNNCSTDQPLHPEEDCAMTAASGSCSGMAENLGFPEDRDFEVVLGLPIHVSGSSLSSPKSAWHDCISLETNSTVAPISLPSVLSDHGAPLPTPGVPAATRPQNGAAEIW